MLNDEYDEQHGHASTDNKNLEKKNQYERRRGKNMYRFH